jgi:hypothetical protein
VAPRFGCGTTATSSLSWQQDGGAGDKLIWKWTKGQTTFLAEFADPTTSADYALCVYTGAGGALLSEIDVPAHPFRWQSTGSGFKYKDSTGAAAGVNKMVLKSSVVDKAKALLKAAGTGLPDPVLGSLATPVRAQLVNLDTLVCWEGAFNGADVKVNTTGLFKAKAKN